MNTAAISAAIYEQFENYRAHERNSGLRMVPCLVDVVAESVAMDLKRFEWSHDSDNSETHKQAAFLVYWMSKVKPVAIQVYHRHTKYITINEMFAFLLAMKLLGVDSRRVSTAFVEDFVYDLYFRDTSPKQMFLTFGMLDRLNATVPGMSEIV